MSNKDLCDNMASLKLCCCCEILDLLATFLCYRIKACLPELKDLEAEDLPFNLALFSEFSSVQFSCSVVFDSLRPHGLQQARPPCPSPTPGARSHSCPLSW